MDQPQPRPFRPETAEATVRECVGLGIKRVRTHRDPAREACATLPPSMAEHEITVIEGGCPCMFSPAADPGHRAMRFIFTLTGHSQGRYRERPSGVALRRHGL